MEGFIVDNFYTDLLESQKKILFICGSLHPGHDGVGDYSRNLAASLIKRGVEASIISIMDRGVKGKVEEIQYALEEKVLVLRISQTLSRKDRKRHYDEWVLKFNPAWLSLQYVPYAFSQKGMPFWLGSFLDLDRKSANWHFMIHEVHVEGILNFKLKFIRQTQIVILKRLIKKLLPKVIHTSNLFYKKLLKDISIESQVLGLFGNIDIAKAPMKNGKSEMFQGVFFGAGPQPISFSNYSNAIAQFIENHKKPINLVFCGRPNHRTTDFIKHLKHELDNSVVRIEERGELPADEISELFLQSHFGISRVPPRLIGKSGTSISMSEHGLPLWVPLAKNEQEISEFIDFRTAQYTHKLELIFKLINENKFEVKSRIEEISNQFFISLNG